ncbi:MAG: hypothetical protein ACPL1K_00225 [Candidatus Kryptoniota bacterium]
MNGSEVQQHAADVMLDRGVVVNIPAPKLYRFFGVKFVKHVLKRPKLGTLVAMSRISSELNIDLDALAEGSISDAYVIMSEKGELVARFIAIALLNDKRRIERCTDDLANRLLWHMPHEQLIELFMAIVVLSGVQNFLSTIRFIRQTNILKRTKMSQEESGS